jgi:hypothetical protein
MPVDTTSRKTSLDSPEFQDLSVTLFTVPTVFSVVKTQPSELRWPTTAQPTRKPEAPYFVLARQRVRGPPDESHPKPCNAVAGGTCAPRGHFIPVRARAQLRASVLERAATGVRTVVRTLHLAEIPDQRPQRIRRRRAPRSRILRTTSRGAAVTCGFGESRLGHVRLLLIASRAQLRACPSSRCERMLGRGANSCAHQ